MGNDAVRSKFGLGMGRAAPDVAKRKRAPTHFCELCGAVAWYKGGRKFFCGKHREDAVNEAKKMRHQ